MQLAEKGAEKASSAALLSRSLVRRYSHSASALSPSRLAAEAFSANC